MAHSNFSNGNESFIAHTSQSCCLINQTARAAKQGITEPGAATDVLQRPWRAPLLSGLPP